MRYLLAVLLISATSLLMKAQGTQSNILNQLNSPDHTELAWGAYRAAEEGLTQLSPKIVPLLSLGEPRLQAVAIDALIRLRADVPEQALANFVETRQLDPVLILYSRYPDRHRDFLVRLLDGPLTDTQWLAANDLLSLAPPPGFAAKLLREWKIRYLLTVHGNGSYPGWPEGSGFGTLVRGKTDAFAGFPPVSVYTIHRYSESGDKVLVQEPFPLYFHSGESYSVDSGRIDKDAARFDYLRFLAGAAKDDPVVRLPPNPRFEWVDGEKYRSDAAQFLDAVRNPVGVMVKKLIDRGQLKEADAILWPQIEVQIYDARTVRTTPLPPIDWTFRR